MSLPLRVRELNVLSDILPFNTPASELKAKYKAVIISGGPQSVYTATLKCDPHLFESGLPVLGICYGMQLLAYSTNGKVEHGVQREDGQFVIDVETNCLLFDKMEKRQPVLLTHGDSVVSLVSTKFQPVIYTSGRRVPCSWSFRVSNFSYLL